MSVQENIHSFRRSHKRGGRKYFYEKFSISPGHDKKNYIYLEFAVWVEKITFNIFPAKPHQFD